MHDMSYNMASPEQRGVDISVSKPRDAAAADARIYLKLKPDAPLVEFAVYSSKDGSVARYIGGTPMHKANASPTGRSTRTFLVFDPQTRKVEFLKDTWRIDLPVMEKEGATYEALHNAQVSHIAPFVCGDDIPGHRTRTQDFVSNSGAQRTQRTLRPHQHYRMVLGVVAHGIMSFRSSSELANAMGDALQGKWSFCISGNIAHPEGHEYSSQGGLRERRNFASGH